MRGILGALVCGCVFVVRVAIVDLNFVRAEPEIENMTEALLPLLLTYLFLTPPPHCDEQLYDKIIDDYHRTLHHVKTSTTMPTDYPTTTTTTDPPSTTTSRDDSSTTSKDSTTEPTKTTSVDTTTSEPSSTSSIDNQLYGFKCHDTNPYQFNLEFRANTEESVTNNINLLQKMAEKCKLNLPLSISYLQLGSSSTFLLRAYREIDSYTLNTLVFIIDDGVPGDLKFVTSDDIGLIDAGNECNEPNNAVVRLNSAIEKVANGVQYCEESTYAPSTDAPTTTMTIQQPQRMLQQQCQIQQFLQTRQRTLHPHLAPRMMINNKGDSTTTAGATTKDTTTSSDASTHSSSTSSTA